jgi:integrase
MNPEIAHRKACGVANLDGLTLHGLRRSFASLTEWLEVPAGALVVPKDPIEYYRKLRFHRSVTDASAYGLTG